MVVSFFTFCEVVFFLKKCLAEWQFFEKNSVLFFEKDMVFFFEKHVVFFGINTELFEKNPHGAKQPDVFNFLL